ncbi:tyrosine-type recombinase/integrase [Geodermatophilus sp. URMC 60]
MVLQQLLDTGARVSELCGLELTDVDLDRKLTYVTAKGSRARVAPFGARSAQAVDRYRGSARCIPASVRLSCCSASTAR